jgi:type III pantothenate kinase
LILELDLGNTRGKWRLLDAGEAVADRGAGLVAEWAAGSFPQAWRAGVRRVRIASVLRDEIGHGLAAVLAGVVDGPVEFARAAASCGPVRSGYREPLQLGVDRWLGIVAAYREFQAPLLVAGAGSALTLDLVGADGVHCGGYIIPGPRLMREALLTATDRVRFEPRDVLEEPVPGRDTAECVNHGVVFALTAAVVLARLRAEQQLGCPVQLVLTGGYAEALVHAPELRAAAWRPELVLDGLRWALP